MTTRVAASKICGNNTIAGREDRVHSALVLSARVITSLRCLADCFMDVRGRSQDTPLGPRTNFTNLQLPVITNLKVVLWETLGLALASFSQDPGSRMLVSWNPGLPIYNLETPCPSCVSPCFSFALNLSRKILAQHAPCFTGCQW